MGNFSQWYAVVAKVSPRARYTARMVVGLTVASGAVVIALTPGIASAAPSAPAVISVMSHTQEAKAPAVPPNSDFDFRVAGVRIFSSTDPGSATVNGLGYPGQGFGSSDGPEYGASYTCDNGQTTTTYVYGTDQTTQVSGFVPLCNLVSVT